MESNNFKHELKNLIIWLVLYIAIITVAGQALSNLVIKIPNSLSFVLGIILTVVLIVYLKKHDKMSCYGLTGLSKLNHKKLLYYAPFILLVSVNLWFGIHIPDNSLSLIFDIAICLVVGFWEEMLFRSFFVRTVEAKCKSETKAIIISSLIFGAAHLINAFIGADLIPTILQFLYTTTVGFMFSAFFIKTKNIIPAIICHACTNITNIFMPENLSMKFEYTGAIAMIIISSGYALYLLKHLKDN